MLHSTLLLRTAVKPNAREERIVSYSFPQVKVSKAVKKKKRKKKKRLHDMNIRLKSFNGSFGIFLEVRISPLGNKFFKYSILLERVWTSNPTEDSCQGCIFLSLFPNKYPSWLRGKKNKEEERKKRKTRFNDFLMTQAWRNAIYGLANSR